MKRIMTLVLALMLVCSLAACGCQMNTGPDTNTTETNNTTQSTTTAPTIMDPTILDPTFETNIPDSNVNDNSTNNTDGTQNNIGNGSASGSDNATGRGY